MARVPTRSVSLLFAFTLAGAAGAHPLAAQERPWTVEAILDVHSVGAPEVSPDGSLVVYTVGQRDMEDDEQVTHLWLVPTDGNREALQLTNSPEGERSPAWAPDGSWIAFVSSREGEESQVWGIRPDGGEAWRVTEHPTGVGGFELAPSGRRVAFTASPEKSEEEEEAEELRGRPEVWDSAYASDWSRAWVAELDDQRRAGEARPVTPEGHQVQGVVWGPDSRRLAWSARPSPVLRTYPLADTWVASVPVEGEEGAPRSVSALPGGEGPVAWVEGLGLLVSASGHELGTYNDEIWLVDPDGGSEPTSLTEAFDHDPSFVAADPDALWLEAYEGTRRRLWRLPLDDGRPAGEPMPVSDDARFYWGFSPSDDRVTWTFVAESHEQPPEIHVVRGLPPGGFAPRRLTDTNPQVADLAMGEQRVVRWRNRDDGEPIEGVLTLPVGYEEGEAVPLLLVIHGGPSGVSTERFLGRGGAYPIPVFSGRGYATLQPNYRGSTGYGERFRALNRGDISGSDWVDVDSGVDFLIEEGLADPDRLGVMGWSFGGHHTYWGITRTDRYEAASAGAGANDLVSMYSQTDIPEFYHTYLGPRPWEDFDLYEERSAYRYVERVTTPLLIQVGERDERVPAEQSIQFYVAMKAIGNAPVKLVVYPGQPHGVRSPRLQRDLMERNVEWFERWIPTEGAAAEEGGG